MAERFPCEFVRENGAPCGNHAAWRVGFITPDTGEHMRRRKQTNRCYWHTDAKWFPQGTTGVTTLGPASNGLRPLEVMREPTGPFVDNEPERGES